MKMLIVLALLGILFISGCTTGSPTQNAGPPTPPQPEAPSLRSTSCAVNAHFDNVLYERRPALGFDGFLSYSVVLDRPASYTVKIFDKDGRHYSGEDGSSQAAGKTDSGTIINEHDRLELYVTGCEGFVDEISVAQYAG